MHPALERLSQLAADAKKTELSNGFVCVTDSAEDAAWSCAIAMPALIATLVEIERWANHSGTYGITATVVNEIIHRHLEPLK